MIGFKHKSLPNDWCYVQLQDVCELNPSRTNLNGRSEDAPTTFVPMSAINEVTGSIASPETKTYREVRRGYTYFSEGDILFAKITPCMQNGKHAIARDLIDGIGFGSTEFHVIRPSKRVMSAWVHLYLRQPSI